jgi:hypothetical protein
LAAGGGPQHGRQAYVDGHKSSRVTRARPVPPGHRASQLNVEWSAGDCTGGPSDGNRPTGGRGAALRSAQLASAQCRRTMTDSSSTWPSTIA